MNALPLLSGQPSGEVKTVSPALPFWLRKPSMCTISLHVSAGGDWQRAPVDKQVRRTSETVATFIIRLTLSTGQALWQATSWFHVIAMARDVVSKFECRANRETIAPKAIGENGVEGMVPDGIQLSTRPDVLCYFQVRSSADAVGACPVGERAVWSKTMGDGYGEEVLRAGMRSRRDSKRAKRRP